jgi:hypothetical protein
MGALTTVDMGRSASMSRMTDSRASLPPWVRVVAYFLVFFCAMVLAGVLFTLGGVGIILVPGTTPTWLAIGYIGLGVVGSVAIALLVANRAFRVVEPRPEGVRRSRTPTLLGWIAGIAGTVIASVLSAALGAVVSNWLSR